jgi:outer membrane protein
MRDTGNVMKKMRITIATLTIIACCLAGDAAAEIANTAELLTLDESVAYSLANNFDVKIARLDFKVEAANILYSEAVFDTFITGGADFSEDRRKSISVFGADLTRRTSFNGGVSTMLRSGTQVDVSIGDTRDWTDTVFVTQNPAYTATGEVSVRQPVANNAFGYIDRRRVTMTRLAVDNADLTMKDRIEDSIAATKKSYWIWVFRKESLAIYEDILAKAEKLQETNISNYDMGRIERVDLLASEGNVVSRRNEVITARNSLRRAEENLKLVMNMDSGFRIAPEERLEYEPRSITLEECLHTAFAARRDYDQARREIEIQKISLEAAKNDLWPEIDIVGTFAMNGIDSSFDESMKTMFGKNNTDYYGGIEVRLPIQNSAASSEEQKARYRKERAIVNLKRVERLIITEVGNAYRDYRTFDSVLGTLIEAARIETEKLAAEEKRFSYGRSNTKRLIDYQQDDLRARHEVALGILNLATSDVDLDRSMNVLLEEYRRFL